MRVPVDRYDKAMPDSCLFAFYKNTMAGMDYTGYLDPEKLRQYGKKGRPGGASGVFAVFLEVPGAKERGRLDVGMKTGVLAALHGSRAGLTFEEAAR